MDIQGLNGKVDLSKYLDALRTGAGGGTKIPIGQAMTHTVAFRDHVALELATADGLTRSVQYLDDKIETVERRLSDRIDNVEARLGDRIDALEKSIEIRFLDFKAAIHDMIDYKIDQKFAEVDRQFGEVDKQFSAIRVQLAKFENLETRITLKLGGLIIGAMTFIEVFQKFWS